MIHHRSRDRSEFVGLLRARRDAPPTSVDPRSKRHPHFAATRVAAGGGIASHFPGLGGHRKPRRDSPNTAWRHDGFRGYADYMQTGDFEAALDDLVAWSGAAATAIMCAEAVWWQCHRQLTADALVARGVRVAHIMSATSAPAHTLTDFARVANGAVTYPGLI